MARIFISNPAPRLRILAACLLASACFLMASAPVAHALSDADTGGLLGAGIGGAVGSQFGRGAGNLGATVGGIALGGIAGYEIGQSMESSGNYSYYASSSVYPGDTSGTSDYDTSGIDTPEGVPWQPTYYGTQTSGPYVVQQVISLDRVAPDSRFCHPYQQTFQMGGNVQQHGGIACLQADGSWQPIN